MFGSNEIAGKKWFKDAPKDSLFVTSIFLTLQGEGPFAGQPALFIRLAKCNLDCSFCFVPSTKITMGNGKTQRIDTINVGDTVMSWSGDKFEPKKVIKTYKSIAERLIKVEVNCLSTTWCTPEHPFLVSGKGWVNAENLQPGDKLVHYGTSERMTQFNPMFDPANRRVMSEHNKIREKVAEFINNGLTVKKVTEVTDNRGFARLYGTKDAERVVYNLEVEDNHTYIANNCVVHNCDTFFDDGDWLTFEQIKQKMHETITAYWADKGQEVPQWAINTRTEGKTNPGIVLVLTGGEPLLQENISEFMSRQLGDFKAVQVESNGIPDTRVPEGVTLVCSPKCMEKNGVAVKYYSPSKTILDRADCLKFVMSADPESPYNNVPQWAHDWKARTGKDIYCSPMNIYNDLPQKIKLTRAEKGVITMAERSTVDEKIDFWEKDLLNQDANEKNHKYTARYCLDNGFKLNLQMHLYAGLA